MQAEARRRVRPRGAESCVTAREANEKSYIVVNLYLFECLFCVFIDMIKGISIMYICIYFFIWVT